MCLTILKQIQTFYIFNKCKIEKNKLWYTSKYLEILIKSLDFTNIVSVQQIKKEILNIFNYRGSNEGGLLRLCFLDLCCPYVDTLLCSDLNQFIIDTSLLRR